MRSANTLTCSPDIPADYSMEEIRQSAWVGDAHVTGPVRGVIVNFHGLNCGGMRNSPATDESEWAAAGGLVVYPYYGPWSWMNRSARRFVDRLIPSVFQQFKVPADVPLIIIGGSMGGQGALIYTRYCPHRVAACLSDFPVCDLAYHFTERPDLPPTMRYAYRDYADFAAAIEEHSPLAQANAMPDIPYLLIHGDKDTAVNKQRHSDAFAAAMRVQHRELDYIEVPGMGHGNNIPPDVSRRRIDWVKGFLLLKKV